MSTVVDQLKAFTGASGIFEVDIRDTYFALRIAAGGIGLILPVVLIAWGLGHDIAWSKMNSLSAFYWLSLDPPTDANAFLRTWFVGSLAAVGTCLIIYRGYGALENWLLNFAGIGAIMVALKPMLWK